MSLVIRQDDLSGSPIAELLREHLRSLQLVTPPESCHALDINALKNPGVIFWSAWDGSDLAGCGALKELDDKHAEIKSMRTVSAYLRKGVATKMLQHIIEEAKRRGYRRLSLETGSTEPFEPARRLYASFGFKDCGPFRKREIIT
jgi:putative acetyltransferase